MPTTPMRLLYLILGLSLILLASGCLEQPHSETVHLHADFAVYLNGERFNFAQEKYMTESKTDASRRVHLHDLDGNVIHVHAAGVTLGEFFESIGMKLETTWATETMCLTLDDGTPYCAPIWGCHPQNGTGETICVDPGPDSPVLHIVVNGQTVEANEDYVLKDLDRVLVSYAKISDDIQPQIAAVTDTACIQSEKCPERGSPGDESSCAGTGDCPAGPIAT